MSDELQTLRRGLQALAFLSRHGPAKVAGIARELGVPRASAHRIVNTLANEGYCRKVPNSHLYIADACRRETEMAPCANGLITSVSIDIVEGLARIVKWPIALATPDGDSMVVRLATHLSTPLAIAKIAPGHRAGMLDAATGVTYLAHCGDEEREAILSGADVWSAAGALRDWRCRIGALMGLVRNDGYFILRRAGSEASLGVPVLIEGVPVAGLSMRYIKSATNEEQLIEAYVPHLQAAAEEIAEALGVAQHGRSHPGSEQRPVSARQPGRQSPASLTAAALA